MKKSILWGLVMILAMLLFSGCTVQPTQPVQPTATATPRPTEIPIPTEYKILERINLSSGKGVYVSVLILTPSVYTPEVGQQILTRGGFVGGSFYASEEALKADFSESYRIAHPDAMDDVLGMVGISY